MVFAVAMLASVSRKQQGHVLAAARATAAIGQWHQWHVDGSSSH